MLARSFMSHVDLGITEEEHSALVTVLGMLERGELRHVDHPHMVEPIVPNGFHMADWCHATQCGTAACIGGWVERTSGVNLGYGSLRWDSLPEYTQVALQDLFYPEEMNDNDLLSKMTDKAAALALSNYLTTGKPDWKSVLVPA